MANLSRRTTSRCRRAPHTMHPHLQVQMAICITQPRIIPPPFSLSSSPPPPPFPLACLPLFPLLVVPIAPFPHMLPLPPLLLFPHLRPLPPCSSLTLPLIPCPIARSLCCFLSSYAPLTLSLFFLLIRWPSIGLTSLSSSSVTLFLFRCFFSLSLNLCPLRALPLPSPCPPHCVSFAPCFHFHRPCSRPDPRPCHPNSTINRCHQVQDGPGM